MIDCIVCCLSWSKNNFGTFPANAKVMTEKIDVEQILDHMNIWCDQAQ